MNYNELSEKLLLVRPEKGRCIKGSINLKNLVYFELNKRVKALDFDNLSEEDHQLIDKWKAVNSLTVVLKSFIPYTYLRKISSKQEEVRQIYRKLCIDDDVPYMTKKNWEDLKDLIKAKAEESNEIINEVCDNWEEVERQFIEKLEKILPDFENEELVKIAKESLPSKEKFKMSYKKTFRFSVSNITNNTTFIDFDTNEEVDNAEHFKNEIEEIIKGRMLDVYHTMDYILHTIQYNTEVPSEDQIKLRPKRRIDRLVASLARASDFFTSSELNETEEKLKELYTENDDIILFDGAEKLGLKVYEFLKNKKYISGLPENSVYFNLDKINEIRLSL